MRQVKRHFDYNSQDEPIMTPEKKFESDIFNTPHNSSLVHIKKNVSSNYINTRKIWVFCTRLANYRREDSS
jgi:hypothetical protein